MLGSKAAQMVVLVYESCHRHGVDPSRWRAGSELREMETALLNHDEKLLLEMEDELSLDERRAVAKMVRRHSAANAAHGDA